MQTVTQNNNPNTEIIQILRLPMAILVVCIHCALSLKGWQYDHIFMYTVHTNLCAYIVTAISRVLAHSAVPVFFVISGYLFFLNFDGAKKENWIRKYKRRLFSIVLPYIIWNVLYLLCKRVTNFELSMLWDYNKWNLNRVDLWGNLDIATSPILSPMWYLRDLIVLFLLSPLFYFLLKKRPAKFILNISLFVFFFLYLTQTAIPISGFSIASIFYYSLGSFASLQKTNLFLRNHNIIKPICVLYIILITIEILLDGHNSILGNIIYPFYILTSVVLIFQSSRTITLKNLRIGEIVKKFTSANKNFIFFLYASHIFINDYVYKSIGYIINSICGVSRITTVEFSTTHPLIFILCYFAYILFTILTCWGGYIILNRLVPNVVSVACGQTFISKKS